MAIESLIGGSTSVSELSESSLLLLNSVLEDTINNESSQSTTTSLLGGILVSGTGGNLESQSALITSGAFSGEVNLGSLRVDVDAPGNFVITGEGPSASVEASEAVGYFKSVIDAALPNASGANFEFKNSFEKAVELATDGLAGPAFATIIQVADSGASSGNQVQITGSGDSDKVVAVKVGDLSSDKTVVLNDMGRAVIVGSGSVQVSGTNAMFVAGDSNNQSITGGIAADTLVGGGGSDTLTGGLGSDTFGFASGGRFIINDLSAAQSDKLAFSFAGLTTFAQLASLVTGVSQGSNSVTYAFGSAGSITLVGVSPEAVTADLIEFTI